MLTGYFASVEKEKIGGRTIYNSPEAGQKGSSSKAAARSVTRRIMSVTFVDVREVHAMPNKAWHVCGRPRDGERAVSR